MIPKAVYADWDAKEQGQAAEAAWNASFAAYKAAYPELAKELTRRMKGELPKHFAQTAVDATITAHSKAETVASRSSLAVAAPRSYPSPRPGTVAGWSWKRTARSNGTARRQLRWPWTWPCSAPWPTRSAES